jgi:hypothetical protein
MGRAFPFRGRQIGTIPTLEEAVNALPSTPIIFNFKGKDPSEADQLAAALKAARRDVVARKDIFYGAPGPDRAHQDDLSRGLGVEQGKRQVLHQGLREVRLDLDCPRELPQRNPDRATQPPVGLLGLAQPDHPTDGQGRSTSPDRRALRR